MPASRLTMLLEMTTGTDTSGGIRRNGGWSESYYFPTVLSAGDIGFFEIFCLYRAALLPKSARIVGQRYQQILPKGATSTGGLVIPGNPNYRTDIPQMAVLIRTPSDTAPNISHRKLACIPDQFVLDGEFLPDANYTGLLNLYFNEARNWYFLASNKASTSFPIFNIAGDGTLTTTVPHTFVAGQTVHVSRALLPNGTFQSDDYMLTNPITAQAMKLTLWPAGLTTTGGTVSLPTFLFAKMTNGGKVNRVTTRKIGRPFTGFVGRVGKKS